jgi:Predicted acyl esterases
VYEWDLPGELEILGHARLGVTLRSSAAVAYLSAKLCDVFPDGTSALVTRGLLNLTHRTSSVVPEPLASDTPTPVELELEATSWVFEQGHRLRLALAGADWPNVWPPPSQAALTVERDTLVLHLPVVAAGGAAAGTPTFSSPPPGDPHAPETDLPQPPVVWRIAHDVLGRETRAEIAHGARYAAEHGAFVTEDYEGAVGVSTTDPGRAWARARSTYRIAWPEADCLAEARLDLRSDANAYRVRVDVVAEDVDGPLGRHERRWERVIPRRLQ